MTVDQAVGVRQESSDWGRMNRRLVFLDNELEREFRAAERNRNLGQARFVLWLSLGIELVFAAADIFVLPASAMAFLAWRTVLLTFALVAMLGLTYASFFCTRWPVLMTVTVHIFTLSTSLTNVFADVPAMYLTGFMILILATYLVVPLIFEYCVATAITATVVYMAVTAFADVVDTAIWGQLCLQMVIANVIGIAALHRSERIQRQQHLDTRRLDEQRIRYRDLLTSILPAPVADRLERGETVVDEYEDATVLLADIVGFTALVARF